MSKCVFLGTCVAAAALSWTTAAKAEPPVKNDNLTIYYGDVRGPTCDPTNDSVGMITANTPLNTLLYNHTRRAPPPPAPPMTPPPAHCNPLLAPDGHQITLGEFKAVVGRTVVSCINTGTHSALHYSGLQPGGTYSVWIFKVNPSPPPPFLAGGTLGVTALSENHFVASEGGEGEIVRTTPDENLSVFGSIGPCFLDFPAQLHLVYHSDGQTHGPVPGSQETWVVNAFFSFP